MKPRLAYLLILLFCAGDASFVSGASEAGSSSQKEYSAERAAVLALRSLTRAPVMRDGNGNVATVGSGELKAVYFDALEYEGRATRVYARLGLPGGASAGRNVPGIVLVHGGGGSAFKEWVELWTARGYAAISIAVEGQTDRRTPRKPGAKGGGWGTHKWPGPQRAGIYHDSSKPLKAQWMYHAVADTILANSLLRSLPGVNAEKVGVMGISWGGVITSTVIGIDDRFAFAIPTYGCGNLSAAANQYGRSLGGNEFYKQVWDPMVRMDRASMPVLWLSWPGDQHFPLDKQAVCYRAAPGPRMVSLIPGMKHGHGAGWRPPDSYAFADSIVREGKSWSKQTGATVQGNVYVARFMTSKPLNRALLISTPDTGVTGARTWTESPATLKRVGNEWVVTATLPDATTAWFVNVRSGALTVSSDYLERRP